MPRTAGSYRQINVGGETVKAFIPRPLPPAEPPLRVEGRLAGMLAEDTELAR